MTCERLKQLQTQLLKVVEYEDVKDNNLPEQGKACHWALSHPNFFSTR